MAAFTSVHALSLFFVSQFNSFLCGLSCPISFYSTTALVTLSPLNNLHLPLSLCFLLSVPFYLTNIPLQQSEAVDGEQSRIYYLGFRGDTRYTKKEVNSRIEVPAPNAAEAALADKVTHKVGSQQTTAR